MHKRVLSLVMVFVLTLALAVPAFAAGKTEEIYGVSVSNVTSWSEDNDSTVIGNWSEDDLSEGLWLFSTRVYCDAAPVTISIEKPAANALTGAGAIQWAWDDDVKTEPTGNFVKSDMGAYYGSLVLNEPGIYLFEYGYGQFAGGEMFAGDGNGFCVIVGGSAVTPTPAPITPAPTSPTQTPAPAATAPSNAEVLATKDRLVSVIPPSPTAGQDLMYMVQPGETLWGIVWNYYGTMSTAKINEVYAANAEYFRNSRKVLEPGAVIKLPVRGLVTPVTQSSLSGAAGMYLVRGGDTLAAIAKHFYGNANMWGKIQEANKDRVKGTLIYEGQWLVIPQ